ncbi:MAG: hypothetical protein ACPGPE_13525, partial [Planctomycetota bacterium]
DGEEDEALAAVARRRRAVASQGAASFVGDHTLPQTAFPAPDAVTGAPPALQLEACRRISGIDRTPQEPFGRGLGSGLAFFIDGSLLVQGAYGLLLVGEENDGWEVRARRGLDEVFGTNRPIVRASSSAGGWKSYPASDGEYAALVFGRGNRLRPFLDVEVPPAGNMLGLLRHAPNEQGLDTEWVLRDGYRVSRPAPKAQSSGEPAAPLVSRSGRMVAGWDFGRGWEFQPGPVMVDDSIFVLARGLGDSTHEESTPTRSGCSRFTLPPATCSGPGRSPPNAA